MTGEPFYLAIIQIVHSLIGCEFYAIISQEISSLRMLLVERRALRKEFKNALKYIEKVHFRKLIEKCTFKNILFNGESLKERGDCSDLFSFLIYF